MKIYAPVKDFNGLRNNVRFVNGVGETDNPFLITWFESHGYRIVDESHIAYVQVNVQDNVQDSVKIVKNSELVETNALSEKIPNISDEPDFDSMTPLELREWARANGLGYKIKNTRNKEKLLEIIRG